MKLTDKESRGSIVRGKLPEISNMNRERILRRHKFKVFFLEKDGLWRTYLPDESKKYGRKPISSKSKEHLENKIIDFYLSAEDTDGDNIVTSGSRLKDVYQEWLIFRRDLTSVKPKTIQENVNAWNKFFEGSTLSNMPIKDIQARDILRYYMFVTKDREYTAKRIKEANGVLNGIMKFAIMEGLIGSNPVRDVDLKYLSFKPVDRQIDNVYSHEDTIKLLTYLKTVDNIYSLAIQLSFYLFIRVGETKALKWQDVNVDKRRIHICRQVTQQRMLNDDFTFSKVSDVVFDQIKGNRSSGFRTQYLTEEAISILNKVKKLYGESEYIFMHRGRVLSTDSFNKNLKRYCMAAGVPYRSSHKIRFYNASTAYNGKNLVELSKNMGHAQTSTTLHYLRDVNKQETNPEMFSNLGLSTENNNDSN